MPLDATFAALADSTRRGVLERLLHSDASVTDLAERFDMTLTGMKKHIDVLERAGLVATHKQGRVRTCTLGNLGLQDEVDWITRHRQLWAARFAALDDIVEDLKRRENSNVRSPA